MCSCRACLGRPVFFPFSSCPHPASLGWKGGPFASGLFSRLHLSPAVDWPCGEEQTKGRDVMNACMLASMVGECLVDVQVPIINPLSFRCLENFTFSGLRLSSSGLDLKPNPDFPFHGDVEQVPLATHPSSSLSSSSCHTTVLKQNYLVGNCTLVCRAKRELSFLAIYWIRYYLRETGLHVMDPLKFLEFLNIPGLSQAEEEPHVWAQEA